MKDILSICIVVYRNYDDAIKAIESIESKTNRIIRKCLYIVDNSCYDSSNKDVIHFYECISKYKDIKYINTKNNIGFGRAHNLMIDEIESKYHAIVNPDIELIEDSFSKIIDYLDENENIGMCIPNLVDFDGNRQYACRLEITLADLLIRTLGKNIFVKRYNEHIMKNKDYSKPFDVPFAQGSFLVIRTELFKNLRGFDNNFFMYMEDADLCKRVNECSNIKFFPHTTVKHKWEKGSHKNIKLTIVHIKSIFYYFSKWGIKIL